MTTLLERLQAALAPDYEVTRELGSGGMGVVFLGRDVALGRRVAIKIIRPDRATAVATERFVREARILAGTSHPNLVPVHRAGEAQGFSYYVMDFLEAETLAERLRRGRLPPHLAVAVARDVLAALEAMHRGGIVHRDVKPGNIFVLDDRAVIGDLGVAKITADGEPPLTDAGKAMGSPGYMAPEQMAGRDVTPAADLFAVGLVLYEALTGRAWSFDTDPARGDWSGVPRHLVTPLQRALAWSEGDRWRSAAEFRAALGEPERTARRRAMRWGTVAVAAAAVAVVVGVRIATRRARRPAATTLHIALRPFAVQPAAMRWLGDSLPRALARRLGGSPDFSVATPDAPDTATPGLVLLGTADVLDARTLQLTLRSDTALTGAAPIRLTATGPLASWERLTDSLAYGLLLAIWSGEGGRLAADLPLRALPHSRAGLVAWTEAERAFARAQWEVAYVAYRRALAVDPTCLLCRLRLTDVGRWLGVQPDPTVTAAYRAAADSFPPQYRALLLASFAPQAQRFGLLRAAAERAGDFGLSWFLYGDEIFHRGPLFGYARRDAYAAMQRATVLWPDFAPAWEHLAWIAIGEGEAGAARGALDSLERLSTGNDAFSAAVKTLLEVGYRWRFAPPAEAAAYSDALLRDPRVASFPLLAAGARYQLTFDAPRGAVYLGERFEHLGRGDLEAPGLLAQIYGFLALGEPDSARLAGERLRARHTDPDAEFFLAELPIALLLADSTPASALPRLGAAAERSLATYAQPGGESPAVDRGRDRAAWLLALYAARAGDTSAARHDRALLADEPAPRPFTAFLDAEAEASRGRFAQALTRSAALLALDSCWQSGDPFYRALLHLERAQWHTAAGQLAAATHDLRWTENNDVRATGAPSAAPEAAEVDWSLGTLARWYRARLHDQAGDTAAACVAYAAVRRLWSAGDRPSAARADTAARRLAALACEDAR